jgi:hypothetical protein
MIRIENDALEVVLFESYFVIRNSANKTELRIDKWTMATTMTCKGQLAFLRNTLDLILKGYE